jgi:HPr kinase/phosphorylase
MPSEGAEPVRIHGTLVDVAEVGLLLTGRSGIGKSECALELVVRGHRLVADDVVLITLGESGRPEGYSPELVRHYLELRGIGIVHVPSLFGSSAVADRGPIDLVVHLEAWEADSVERLGLERRTELVAGVEVDALHLPVAPGRNVATLVEVAARNLRMQRTGRIAAAELDQRVMETLRGKSA